MDNQSAQNQAAQTPAEFYAQLSDQQVLDQMLVICRMIDANRAAVLGLPDNNTNAELSQFTESVTNVDGMSPPETVQ